LVIKAQLSVVSRIFISLQNSGIMGNVLNLVFVHPTRSLSLKVKYDVMIFSTSFGMSFNVV
jgi:hypothetical protein